MNNEQQRAAFEAWYGEYLQKVSADSGGYQWPATRRAWDAWKAGRAALQSQDREDAERWRAMKERSVVTFMNDSGRKLMIATVEICEFPKPLTMDGFIDQARRIEGEEK